MNKKELNLILKEKEGQYIEFKESLNSSFSKELVSFANATGGRIFLGVSDNGKVVGVNVTNKLKSKIQDLANNCDPKIEINFEEIGNVLIVNVLEGKNKPYSCSPGFYLRVGPNSQKMKRDEILDFFNKEGKISFDEQICKDFDWNDFDDDKFNYYLKLAKIDSDFEKNILLRNLNVLKKEGITNAGILFFSKNPSKYVLNSKLRCVQFKDNGRVDILDKKEVDKGIIGNIEFAINYLKERIDVRYEIKGAERIEYPEYSLEAYREAIVNAIVHRDYLINGEVAVEKLKSRLMINNPGGSLVEKENFGLESRPRNKLIADLLFRTKYMEKIGTGVNRIKNFSKENGNKVKFDFDKSFIVFIYSKNEGQPKTSQKPAKNQPKTSQKPGKKERKSLILEEIERGNFSKRKFADLLGINKSTVESDLDELKNEGKIEFVGEKRGGHWWLK